MSALFTKICYGEIMKKLFLCILLSLMWCNVGIAKNIPHPVDFKGLEQEKKNIISFIEKNVNEIYCENEMLKSMCTNSVLRMMEDEELTSFKKLTKAKEEVILNNVIQTYCMNVMLEDNCMYSTILMMYEEEVRAAGKKLAW